MRPYQFELGGVLFGEDCPLEVETFEVQPGTTRTTDAESPTDDSRSFGRDLRTPGIWSFAVHTSAASEWPEDAAPLIAQIAAACAQPDDQWRVGEVVPLRYQLDDEPRLVYGRPRDFHEVPDTGRVYGLRQVLFDFVLADFAHYDDGEISVVLGLTPNRIGGLVAPLIAPLTTLRLSDGTPSVADIDGDIPSWAVITIKGPASNPKVTGPGWEIALNANLAYDQTVVIDPRPWARTVSLNGVGSLAGTLRGSRLYDLRMRPGPNPLTFVAGGRSDVARATVSWRTAWRTM